MWKKEEAQERAEAHPERTTPQPEPRQPSPSSRGERATIGPSISIRGDVTGDEDLLIQGRVEGSVELKQHAITIGPEGNVKADISGRVVTVEGTVEGNLRADEQVVLRSAARVIGDISAPRVILEDGAYFRGGVDMAEPAGPGRSVEAGRAGTRSAEAGGRLGGEARPTPGEKVTPAAESGAASPARA
ncbi:hypothetical protein BH23GEM9_BH23GEM9_29200 [soil metagenome]